MVFFSADNSSLWLALLSFDFGDHHSAPGTALYRERKFGGLPCRLEVRAKANIGGFHVYTRDDELLAWLH